MAQDIQKLDPNSLISGMLRAIGAPVRTGTVVVGTAFGEVAKCLYVGGNGDITVVKEDGTTQEFINVLPGTWFPITCTQVTASTATDLVWGS